ncbi:hypothetical protein HIM_09644 [Hirsutella minnesotensis 3608]|uniref:HAT C-terminal dimerisation domain-containing protein n=1 Tax=Hirsutella minnesotensis 3608 TaxID=1043627 RepID=A0A0F7ZL53_9HYPO|nr:hypothetical protein HIM_09644 [Hirsutella minnesotensis 3608]
MASQQDPQASQAAIPAVNSFEHTLYVRLDHFQHEQPIDRTVRPTFDPEPERGHKTWEDRQDWIERAKARVGQLWRDEYKPATQCCDIRQIPEQMPHTRRPNGYKAWMKEQKATIFSMDDDEYDVYCREPVMMVPDPLKWWLDPAQRRRFPGLSLMAIDILSIASMSAETERLFSKAKLSVTDQRGSMNVETLNLLECLRSWDASALILPTECQYINGDRDSSERFGSEA